jgi:hypothetical protein
VIVIVWLPDDTVDKLLNISTNAVLDNFAFAYDVENREPDKLPDSKFGQLANTLAKFAADDALNTFSGGTDCNDVHPLNMFAKFVPLLVLMNGIDFKLTQLINICEKLVPFAVFNGGTEINFVHVANIPLNAVTFGVVTKVGTDVRLAHELNVFAQSVTLANDIDGISLKFKQPLKAFVNVDTFELEIGPIYFML